MILDVYPLDLINYIQRILNGFDEYPLRINLETPRDNSVDDRAFDYKLVAHFKKDSLMLKKKVYLEEGDKGKIIGR